MTDTLAEKSAEVKRLMVEINAQVADETMAELTRLAETFGISVMPVDHSKPFMPHGVVHAFSGTELNQVAVRKAAANLIGKINIPYDCGLMLGSLSCDLGDLGYEWSIAYRLTGNVPRFDKPIPLEHINTAFINLVCQELMKRNVAIRSEANCASIVKHYRARIKPGISRHEMEDVAKSACEYLLDGYLVTNKTRATVSVSNECKDGIEAECKLWEDAE